MPVEIISTPLRVTAILSGEIDHHNAPALRAEIDEALQRQRPPMLRLDFNDVTFMDSSGVGLVMGRYRTLQTYGGRLEAVNLTPQTYKVFRLSGIEKLAKIKQKEEVKK